MDVGWTTPEAGELYSPVISSELGDTQVQQLLAHQNVFRLSWGKRKLPFSFFVVLIIDALQMGSLLFNKLQ